MIKLQLKRIFKGSTYTIGKLYVNGEYFCDTLEDTDRGLDDSMSVAKIKSLKKSGITAIPSGTYDVTLDVYSPKFGPKSFYKETCNGKLPRLLNVKGFDGILIHAGNTDKDTSGCLLVGVNSEVGKVLNSQDTFRKLYKLLQEGKNRGEKITIKIL